MLTRMYLPPTHQALFGDGNHFVGGAPGSTMYKRALAAAVAEARRRRREDIGETEKTVAPMDIARAPAGGEAPGVSEIIAPAAPTELRSSQVLGGRAARFKVV